MVPKTEILLNKTKIVKVLIGALIFILLSILFINSPTTFTSSVVRSPEIIKITGIVGLCFFGASFIFIIHKLFDKRPGLIIDQYGIINNTNLLNVGLISWDDITKIEARRVMSTEFLVIHTKTPEKYIGSAKNIVSKWLMNMNYRTYGSPISIASNSLKIDFNSLELLIKIEFEKKIK